MSRMSRRRLWLTILILACTPTITWAQVGRTFVSVEAFVGLARVVHVGKIVELKAIEYDQPLTDTQKIGKPYRLVFAVSETIRGEKVEGEEAERLELVLSLQSSYDLAYLREQGAELMLVGGPNSLRTLPRPEIGIEEQGQRVDGEWYQFRLLDPLPIPKSGNSEFGDPAEIAAQLNRSYDACRMFTSDLEVVQGRKAILQRARAFAKEHTQQLSGVSLRVPNDFGALVGSPNAYCMITLPICPATQQTLTALKADPSRILRRIKSEDEEWWLSHVRAEIDKALAKFAESE
jgi:hypothetical protein